jgi:hypothetical protein
MIVSSTVTNPFIVNKDGDKDSPEGRFTLHFYNRKIIHENRVMYKYYPLRFNGELARFKTKNEAKDYARYRLGID